MSFNIIWIKITINKIKETKNLTDNIEPGKILDISFRGVLVSTKDKAIIIKKVLEGDKKTNASRYFKSLGIIPGNIFDQLPNAKSPKNQ